MYFHTFTPDALQVSHPPVIDWVAEIPGGKPSMVSKLEQPPREGRHIGIRKGRAAKTMLEDESLQRQRVDEWKSVAGTECLLGLTKGGQICA